MGASAAGSRVPSIASVVSARRSTRWPEAWWRADDDRAPAGMVASITSGAPRIQVPRPAKVTALHFLVEEKGTRASTVQPWGGEPMAARARMVALGVGSDTA